ncbi:MAG: hypothetical protein AB7L92_03720 [Alphaproteobacteria bacterium]
MTNEYEQLFSEYLKVCNQVLEKNKDRFPYKQLWDTTEKICSDQDIKMAIYDDRPKECLSLTIKGTQLQAKPCQDDGVCKYAWRMNYSYLKNVVDKPEEYIKHPAKLDWDWLKNRLGN